MIEDSIDMGNAYRWWIFRVLSDFRRQRADAFVVYAFSLRPGPWGDWTIFC